MLVKLVYLMLLLANYTLAFPAGECSAQCSSTEICINTGTPGDFQCKNNFDCNFGTQDGLKLSEACPDMFSTPGSIFQTAIAGDPNIGPSLGYWHDFSTDVSFLLYHSDAEATANFQTIRQVTATDSFCLSFDWHVDDKQQYTPAIYVTWENAVSESDFAGGVTPIDTVSDNNKVLVVNTAHSTKQPDELWERAHVTIPATSSIFTRVKIQVSPTQDTYTGIDSVKMEHGACNNGQGTWSVWNLIPTDDCCLDGVRKMRKCINAINGQLCEGATDGTGVQYDTVCPCKTTNDCGGNCDGQLYQECGPANECVCKEGYQSNDQDGSLVCSGTWGNFQVTKQCSVDCGGGQETVTRTCLNDELCYSTQDQLAKTEEVVQECNTQSCQDCNGGCGQYEECINNACSCKEGYVQIPQNDGNLLCSGNWGSWQDVNSCNKDCGGGEITRMRICANNENCYSNGEMKTSESDTFACNTQACDCNGGCGQYEECINNACSCKEGYVQIPQNDGSLLCSGNWGAWQDVNSCSKDCGGGLITRVRICANNENCYWSGEMKTTESLEFPCNSQDCDCTNTGCSGRYQECGGNGICACKENYNKQTTADGTLVCTGTWDDWVLTKECSAECDGGQATYQRTCKELEFCYTKEGVESQTETEVRACNTQPCDCNGGCGEYQECINNICFCQENYVKIDQADGSLLCSGNWGSWQDVNTCSKDCGGGEITRFRQCSNSEKCYANDGEMKELETQTFTCNTQACDCTNAGCPGIYQECGGAGQCLCLEGYIEISGHGSENGLQCAGEWDNWVLVGECSKDCGGGNQVLSRTCKGGNLCFAEDNTMKTTEVKSIECNSQECVCNNACTGDYQECVQSTNLCACQDGFLTIPQADGSLQCSGEWTTWQAVGECSKDCGGGDQLSTRSCNDGNLCFAEDNTMKTTEVKTIECNPQECVCNNACTGDYQECVQSTNLCACEEGFLTIPQTDGSLQCSGEWTTWQAVGECSKDCGGGDQLSTRSCNDGNLCFAEDNTMKTTEVKTIECNPQECVCNNACTGDYQECVQSTNLCACEEGFLTIPQTDGSLQCSGNWGSWQDVNTCSKDCGGGEITRFRQCSNSEKCYANDGEMKELETQTFTCNTQACDCTNAGCPGIYQQCGGAGQCLCLEGYIEISGHGSENGLQCAGEWDNWVLVGECSKDCGGGNQVLSRTCKGGNLCFAEDNTMKTTEVKSIECNSEECVCNNACTGDYQECVQSTNLCACQDGFLTIPKSDGSLQCSGVWTTWQAVGECSKDCGGGDQFLTRSCNDGNLCFAEDNTMKTTEAKSIECNPQECVCNNACTGDYQECVQSKNLCACEDGFLTIPQTDGSLQCSGEWTTWQAVGECSKDCGGGDQFLTRSCNDGNLCFAEDNTMKTTEAKRIECNAQECVCNNECTGVNQECIIDNVCQCKEGTSKIPQADESLVCSGQWGEWKDLTDCDQTCGDGKKTIERTCLDGQTCYIANPDQQWITFERKEVVCKIRDCDCRDVGCTSGPYQECGTDGICKCQESYNEISPVADGLICAGFWDVWTLVGDCSEDCGGGLQILSRTCNDDNLCYTEEKEMKTTEVKSIECNTQECDCNNECTGDYQKCLPTNACACQDGFLTVPQADGSLQCSGEWATWEAVGECSKDCGGGDQILTRSCNDGNLCFAEDNTMKTTEVKTIECNSQDCACNNACTGDYQECVQSTNLCACQDGFLTIPQTDGSLQCSGEWTNWEAVGECSKDCGGGDQFLTRSCNDDNLCFAEDNTMKTTEVKTIECNSQECFCNNACTGDYQECVQSTNLCACQDGFLTIPQADGSLQCSGEWTTWQAVGGCSEDCGGGLQLLTRSCKDGNLCFAEDNTMKTTEAKSSECNAQECDCSGGCGLYQKCGSDNVCRCDDGFVVYQQTPELKCGGVWTDWVVQGTCSAGCGDGVQTWTRQCKDFNQCYKLNGELATIEVEQRPCKIKECDCQGGCNSGLYQTCVDNQCVCQSSTVTIPQNDGSFKCSGTFGDWYSIGVCSEACGDGLQQERRDCQDNKMCYTSTGYLYHETRESPCQIKVCDCNGGCMEDFSTCVENECVCEARYSRIEVEAGVFKCSGTWSDWTEEECSKDCGKGVTLRSRFCINGAKCFAEGIYKRFDEIESDCIKTTCDCGGSCHDQYEVCGDDNVCRCKDGYTTQQLANGDFVCTGTFSNWVQVGACSEPCGPGQAEWQRICQNGEFCYTSGGYVTFEKEMRSCNVKECDCSGGCAESFTTCVNNECVCESLYTRQEVEPFVFKCSGTWSDWQVGECSEDCGPGTVLKTRSCTGGAQCYADGSYKRNDEVEDVCNRKECNCNGNCGLYQECADNTCVCKESHQTILLEDGTGFVCAGYWGAYAQVGTCSAACGSGQVLWSRNCLNGQLCYNEVLKTMVNSQGQLRDCKLKDCDCAGGCDGLYQECSANNECVCKPGYLTVTDNNGGFACSGTWEDWEQVSVCTEPCGNGLVEWRRICQDGKFCYTANGYLRTESENRHCHLKECDCNGGCTGEFTECVDNECVCQSLYSLQQVEPNVFICSGIWSDWTVEDCDASCGPGKRFKTRSCIGGAKCYAEGIFKRSDEVEEACNLKPCDCNGLCTQPFQKCGDNNQCVCEDGFVPTQISNQILCSGEWGAWENGECSADCGPGQKLSQRKCLNKAFCYDNGDWHAGQITQTDCQIKPCDCDGGCTDANAQCVDNECVCKPFYSRLSLQDGSTICSGTWSAWTEGECLANCGTGMATTQRTCQNGAVCYTEGGEFKMSETSSVPCSNGPCDCPGGCGVNEQCVNNNCQCKPFHTLTNIPALGNVCAGIWNDWVDSACLAACGDSFTTSTRTCSDGAFCYTTNGWVTAETKIVSCKNRDCGCVDSGCEDPNAECINNECACKEQYSEILVGNVFKLCSGEWTAWESGSCSEECGVGEVFKTRSCQNGAKCYADGEMKRFDEISEVCLIRACDDVVWNEWRNNGVCSQTTCTVSQIRECLAGAGNVCEGDDDFDGKQYRTVECYDGVCNTANIDGGWSDYSPYSECSVECGNGVQTRVKVCNNPTQHNNGLFCPGDVNNDGVEYQTSACFKDPCPIDGKWGNWKTSECTKTCGGGVSIRYRACDSPAPQFGGQLCDGDEDGVETENIACNEQACNVDGGWGEYGTYGECSNECGGGLQFSYAYCDSPVPSGTGAACSGDINNLGYKMRSRSCNDVPCLDPIHGVWSDWSDWACSNQCISTRKRECASPPPAYGGLFCTHDERIQHYGMDEYESNCCGDVCTKYESQCTENDNCVLNNDGVCSCTDTYNFNFLSCTIVCDPLKNEVYDPSTDSCVCKSGYAKNNAGECVFIQTCGTNERFNIDTKSCECIPGYSLNPNTNQCEEDGCAADEVFHPEKEECVTGYFESTPCLSSCTGQKTYSNPFEDPFDVDCNECGVGGECNANDECVCSADYNLVDDQCVSKCGDNEVYNPSTDACDCISGSVENSVGNCVQTIICDKPNEEFHPDTVSCVCVATHVKSALGTCVLIQTCTGSNEEFDPDNGCVCKPGYVKNSNDECVSSVTCPDVNEVVDVDQQECVCKSGYIYNSANTCVEILTCNINAVFVPDDEACVCVATHVKNSAGTCVLIETCTGSNEEFDPDNGCVCKSGYVKNSNDECVLSVTCSDVNEVFDVDQEKCVCVATHVKNSAGTCVLIETCTGSNEEFDPDSGCVCKSGYGDNGSGTCILQSCTGGDVFHPIEKKCVSGYFESTPCLSSCTGQKTYSNPFEDPFDVDCNECGVGGECNNDDECVCLNGYTLNADSAIHFCDDGCGDNEIVNTNTGQCDCVSGYVKNSASPPVCVQTQTCGANQVFNHDTVLCVCVATHVKNSAGTCVLIETCTGSNEEFDPDSGCVCKSGYGDNGSGTCILQSCTGGDVFHPIEKKCVSGYFESTPCLSSCTGQKTYSNPFEDPFDVDCNECGVGGECNNDDECVCLNGYTLNADSAIHFCDDGCGDNEIVNTNTGQCDCVSGYVKNSASPPVCVQTQTCGANQVFNHDSVLCDCVPTHTKTSTGTCVLTLTCDASTNQEFNPDQGASGACVCKAGYGADVNGDCILQSCTGHDEIFNPNDGTCVTNYFKDDICLQPCTGQERYKNFITGHVFFVDCNECNGGECVSDVCICDNGSDGADGNCNN